MFDAGGCDLLPEATRFASKERRAGEITFHNADHGAGRPVLVLHSAGVDQRKAEACFEPVFGDVAGFRRIYPDLPGLGRTIAPEGLRSAEVVRDALLDFAAEVTDGAASRGLFGV